MNTDYQYIERLTDKELLSKLDSAGALLIRGMKACGKTESAKQHSKSVLKMDQNPEVPLLMETAPQRLLQGENPRLIDEWQEYPKIWNYIRHEVDNRKNVAQFILTGSANPEESIKMHSGAGRFTILDMRTMSWQEMGFSSGKISLNKLFEGEKIEIHDEPTDLEFIVERIIIGGLPGLMRKSIRQARDLNRAYVDLLAEVDMSRVSNTKRDPIKVRNLLRSLARNTATMAEIKTLESDIRDKENKDLSRPTIYDYLDALDRLMITENQPAWNPHIRSSSSLRKAPKRHFSDVALAVASLGIDKKSLLNNLKFTGFLFESLAVHELRVYAQVNDAKVYHYHDSSGLEVDAIVQKYTGEWSAFEIKLGTGQIEDAAKSLKKFVSVIDTDKVGMPKSLNIITGTGISYTRNDGINVISLASLGA
jgi:predicted AAA+ superfamily ATPase